jgi:hypothetical protein
VSAECIVARGWFLAGLALVLCGAAPGAAQGPRFASHPDSARLITEDVQRFWQVLDAAAPDSLAVALEREQRFAGRREACSADL